MVDNDLGQQTPFDRYRQAGDGSLSQDNGDNKEQTIWQKLIAGLRHLFGFETA